MKKEFERSKNKVRCGLCEYVDLEKSYCEIKKATVSLNKKRYCAYHLLDASKIKSKRPTTKSKTQAWNLADNLKKDQRQQLNDLKNRLAKEEKIKVNDKHPIVGDLNRFRTTAKSK